ncbi:hypothetical protein PF010_g24581 [Phytophthora fragariae]|uniref:Uncharacterized protein n=1 Tax=Phytophthora fragariae TaxID=53985 RepID=A0A6G0K347_9STRA|nr:hypothetical protein PF010_g24581 [Phytophthora fragariae]
MPVVTRSRSQLPMDTSSQVMSPHGALAGRERVTQVATSIVHPEDDRYPCHALDTRLQQGRRAAPRAANQAAPESTTRTPTTARQDDPGAAATRSARTRLEPLNPAPATSPVGSSGSRRDGSALTSLRDALVTATSTIGPQQLLAMLLDQVEHCGAAQEHDSPEIRNGATPQMPSGGETVDIGIPSDVDAPLPISPSTSYNRTRRNADIVNDSGSPPSSALSSSRSQARLPRDPNPGSPTRSVHTFSGREQPERPARRSLMDAKDRAMLAREIKVLELDGLQEG